MSIFKVSVPGLIFNLISFKSQWFKLNPVVLQYQSDARLLYLTQLLLICTAILESCFSFLVQKLA